jgi:retron-type reverse transcriptase
MRPGTEPGSGYIEFEIPKAKGGTRRIAAPRTPLRKVQRKILDEILAKVPVHDACHGFVENRSTVTNAAPHVGAAIVIKMDIKDFFPTVHYRRVRGLFQYLGYNEQVAATLAGLTTYRPKLASGHVVWPGVLPQGAPTSPAIANLTCRRLDHRLTRLAAKCGAVYTRYADDLTFSFKTEPDVRIGRFLWWVDGICQQEGFTERADKRRILRAKHQQRVTGLVVNAKVNIPRAERRRFRAILHNCAKSGIESQAREHADFKSYLAGYAAYVHMVDPVLGKHYLAEVARLIGADHG